MKRVINILLLLSLSFPVYSQNEGLTEGVVEQKAERIEIYFDLNSYVVDSLFRDNGASLELLARLRSDSLTTISKVEISS
ncbi:MAG: hypothetical protein SNJ33_07405 [Rikenellaceae bacterium]